MKVYIETYGCAKNKADSEIMKNLIKKEHEITDLDNSEVIILNTCAVKLSTENKILHRLKELTKENKKMVIAGCMAETIEDKIKRINNRASLINPQAVHRINELLFKIRKKEGIKIIEKTPPNKLDFHKSSKKVVDIIPISEGCLGSCSFCITKKARKNLISFPKESIIREIKKSLKKGSKEFWLCAEDTGSYGFDGSNNCNGKCNLAELLNEISQIKGKFKVRVGMMNPNNAIKILKELIDSYTSEKVYKFLHIPVQSGSNKVLEDMKRNYTVKEFKNIIKRFRKKHPKITVSTDIIAGFPTESEKDFKKTLKLLKEIKPDITNISRYGPRPLTLAKKLYRELDSKVVKKRTRILSEFVKKISYERNKGWLNWRGEVLISEKGIKGNFQARNFAYKPVILKEGKLGDFLCVKINKIYKTYLSGEKLH